MWIRTLMVPISAFLIFAVGYQTEQKVTNVLNSAAVLKPGDKFSYKTVKVMKLERNLITEHEIQLVKDSWDKEAENFLIYELKLNDFEFQKYLEAKREVFQVYNSLIEPIEHEVKEKFGDQFQIILGEDLYRLRESSWVSYQNRLGMILGSTRMARFEKFRERYSEWIYQKFNVGWNDFR